MSAQLKLDGKAVCIIRSRKHLVSNGIVGGIVLLFPRKMLVMQGESGEMGSDGNRVRMREVPPKTYSEDRDILLWEIHRAPNTSSSAVEDVRIDHRGVDVSVPQQLLDGSDVVPFPSR